MADQTAVRRASTTLYTVDPDAPDAATTRADLRTALSLAAGATPAEVHPATGHDLSARACRVAARGWVELAARPMPAWRDRSWARRRHAYWRAYWAALHPDVVAAEWPEWGDPS